MISGSSAMLGILHTWSRTLIFHPHVHYLVPGGGLSPDNRQWVASNPKFLLAEKPLALHFRTLFRQHLEKLAPEALDQLPRKIWKQNWGVDCAAAGSGENALAYLARYVFKTATGILGLGRRWATPQHGHALALAVGLSLHVYLG